MAKARATGYKAGKAALLGALQELGQIEPSSAKRAGKIAESLQSGFFTLAIMGQVKRGKTTLANALLGESLLPVDSLPLTSVVNLVRHGESKRFSIVFSGGNRKEVGALQIADYITEERNPKNEKKVLRLEAEYPSDFLAQGVVLVDTPGIGSVHLHNTEITHQFLPEVDAALFVLSPDPPITEPECAFLAESAKYASKFFFALTKSDYLPKAELARVANFNRKVIAEKMGVGEKEILLHTVSAKQALEAKQRGNRKALEASMLPAFERELERFVARHKGELVLRSSAGKALHLAQEMLNQRMVEKSGISSSAGEIKARLQLFDAEMERAHALKEKLDGMIDLEQREILSMLDEELEEFKRSTAPKIAESVRDYAMGFRDCSNEEFNEAVEEFRSELVIKALGDFRDAEEEKISREFSARVGKYSSSVDEIILGVEKAAAGIFKAEIKSTASGERLALESNFYFKLSREGQDTEGPGIELALPRFLYRKRKIGRIAAQVEEDLDRNAGRMRYDFLERMKRSADNFKWQLSDKIDAVAEGIRAASERAMQSRKAGQAQARARLAQIEKDALKLKRIISICEQIRVGAIA